MRFCYATSHPLFRGYTHVSCYYLDLAHYQPNSRCITMFVNIVWSLPLHWHRYRFYNSMFIPIHSHSFNSVTDPFNTVSALASASSELYINLAQHFYFHYKLESCGFLSDYMVKKKTKTSTAMHRI